jgi:hypothetical protein
MRLSTSHTAQVNIQRGNIKAKNRQRIYLPITLLKFIASSTNN